MTDLTHRDLITDEKWLAELNEMFNLGGVIPKESLQILYNKAITEFGILKQMVVAMEECAELIEALSHHVISPLTKPNLSQPNFTLKTKFTDILNHATEIKKLCKEIRGMDKNTVSACLCDIADVDMKNATKGEIADVMIMMQQMNAIFGDVSSFIKPKIERLAIRLDEEKLMEQKNEPRKPRAHVDRNNSGQSFTKEEIKFLTNVRKPILGSDIAPDYHLQPFEVDPELKDNPALNKLLIEERQRIAKEIAEMQRQMEVYKPLFGVKGKDIKDTVD